MTKNVCRILWKQLRKWTLNLVILIVSFIFLFFVPVILLLFSPIYLYRLFIFRISRVIRPELGKMLSTRNTLFAKDNFTTRPHFNMVVFGELEGVPNLELARQTIMDTVIKSRNSKNELKYQELTQFLTKWPNNFFGFYFWKNDINFDIKDHVQFYNSDNPDNIKTSDMLTKIQKEILYLPFKKDKPLWQIYIVKNCKSKEGTDSFYAFLRMHHSVSDAFVIIKIFVEFFGHGEKSIVRPKSETKKSAIKKLRDSILFPFIALFENARVLLTSFDINAWHNPMNDNSGDINTGTSEQIDFSVIKKIAKNHQVQASSVITAAACGGIRRYLIATNKPVPKHMHVYLPLPVSSGHPDKLRNFTTMCVLKLPIGIQNPIKRLQKLEKELLRLKSSTVPYVVFFFQSVIGGLLPSLVNVSFRMFSGGVVVVPGPKEKFNFLGHEAIQFACGITLMPGSIRFVVNALSYGGQLTFSAIADKEIFSTHEAVEEVCQYMLNEVENYSNIKPDAILYNPETIV